MILAGKRKLSLELKN